MENILAVAGFGVLGVLSRYFIQIWVPSSGFPWGTFLINLSGSFLIGLLFGLFKNSAVSSTLQIGLLVGFLGGFTTFSSYSLETLKLLTEQPVTGLTYFILSPILGLLCAWAGLGLSKI